MCLWKCEKEKNCLQVSSKSLLTSKSAFVKSFGEKRCFICIHLSQGIKRVCLVIFFFLDAFLCKQQHQHSSSNSSEIALVLGVMCIFSYFFQKTMYPLVTHSKQKFTHSGNVVLREVHLKSWQRVFEINCDILCIQDYIRRWKKQLVSKTDCKNWKLLAVSTKTITKFGQFKKRKKKKPIRQAVNFFFFYFVIFFN